MKSLLKLLTLAALAVVVAWPVAHAANVTFQVDMSVQVVLGYFDVAANTVVVRGEFNNWGTGDVMSDADQDTVYTITLDLAASPETYEYKFCIMPGEVWETLPANREVLVGTDPITLPVVFFSDQQSSAAADVEVNFRVDMNVQILSGTFDPAVDWVVVRGNHANIGNWGGATRLNEETGNPGVYSLWVQFASLPVNVALEYKFVILDNGDPGAANWESVANRTVTPTGEEPDNLPPPSGNGYGEIQPALVFFSDIGYDDIIANDIDVIFQVDARPLFYRLMNEGYVYDVQTGDTIYSVESLQAAGFFNNWPWGGFAPEYFMNDNGTNGDLTANDTVWSVTLPFAAGSARTQIYKYGANQLDAEAGFARNHDRDLDDSQPTFRMDIDCWGSPDTLFFPYQCVLSGIGDEGTAQPASFVMEQNYPNPFNPSTTISFVLPRADVMTLRVFDILGREAAVRNLGRMDAGQHTIAFDGSSLASGIYFYTLESPHFNATRKMLLMK